MSADENPTTELSQVIIERVRGSTAGGIVWAWSAFGYYECVLAGQKATLSECLDDMRNRLRDEGFVP